MNEEGDGRGTAESPRRAPSNRFEVMNTLRREVSAPIIILLSWQSSKQIHSAAKLMGDRLGLNQASDHGRSLESG